LFYTNRIGHDPDFVESIEMFVDDWRMGLGLPAVAPEALVG
jgi:hypothetical protein